MVAPMLAAAGIGAAGSLLSGLMGSRAAKKARGEQALANAEAMRYTQESNDKANNLLIPAANYNPALTKLMALNGFRWTGAARRLWGIPANPRLSIQYGPRHWGDES